MPQGLTQKNSKVTRVTIIVIIAAVLGGAALYFFTNKTTDNTEQIPAAQVAGQELISATPLPEASKVFTTTTVDNTSTVERFLAFYIDKNHNLTKDSDESVCQACKGKSALIGMQLGGFGAIENLNTMAIDNSAKINTSKFSDHNIVWGNIVDRGLLIIPTNFSLGDGLSDIPIPVWDGTINAAAVNANVSRSLNEDGTVVYEFSKLVPAMKTVADKGGVIWVKFTPDAANDTKYYLTSGKLTTTTEGYSLGVSWESAADALNVLKVENIEFVIP